MISRAMACGRSTVLRRVTFRDHQVERNLFIPTPDSILTYPLSKADHINKLRPAISEKRVAVALSFSTKVNIPVVGYAEIKDLPNHPEKLLIDVREPDELKESGQIPTSINIPLGIVGQELALEVNPKQFQKKYGRPKPDINSYIILHCRSGVRSQNGAEIAAALGYTNIQNYVGSWIDWAEREGLPIPKKN